MNQLRQALPDAIIPEKLVASKEGPDGGTLLLVPRFRKGVLAKLVQPRLKKPYMNISLDKVGSFVWNCIDGKKTVSDIVTAARKQFGKDIEPAEERVRLFLLNLSRNQFIRYLKKIDGTGKC